MRHRWSWRRGCDGWVRLIRWHHSISDGDEDVAGGWRGGVEAWIRVAAVAGDKDITAFGVEVSNWLGFLVLPHSVSDDVTKGVEGFADLSSVWDILWRHSSEHRSLLFILHSLLLHFNRRDGLRFVIWSLSGSSPISILLATVHHVFWGQLFLLQDLLGQDLLAGLDAGDILDGLGDIWTQMKP